MTSSVISNSTISHNVTVPIDFSAPVSRMCLSQTDHAYSKKMQNFVAQ